LQKYTIWFRVLLLIVFSLEVVAFAVIFMYIALFFTMSFKVFNIIVILFAGIVGFALGSLVFWWFSVKFSRWRSVFKR